jgi:hypothetical protein
MRISETSRQPLLLHPRYANVNAVLTEERLLLEHQGWNTPMPDSLKGRMISRNLFVVISA